MVHEQKKLFCQNLLHLMLCLFECNSSMGFAHANKYPHNSYHQHIWPDIIVCTCCQCIYLVLWRAKCVHKQVFIFLCVCLDGCYGRDVCMTDPKERTQQYLPRCTYIIASSLCNELCDVLSKTCMLHESKKNVLNLYGVFFCSCFFR